MAQNENNNESILRELDTLKKIFRSHQHRGGDGSLQLALLDWKELGRAELVTAGTTLTLLNLPPRRFLRIIVQHGAKASNGNTLLRFNGDSGSNYTSISRENAAARASQSSIDLLDTLNNTTAWMFVINVLNIASTVKGVTSDGVQLMTAASGTQVHRKVYGTWVNTADLITRIDVVSSGGNLPVGSQIIVYGSNF